MKNYFAKIYDTFLFDKKTMGFMFFVPALMFILSIFLILLVPGDPPNLIFVQGFFIPSSCWCLMYRLSEMYEDGAQETLIPYYSKGFFLDFLRYLIPNVAGVLLLCGVFVIKYGASSLPSINIIYFLLIMFIFMLLGTALLVSIKNIEISLTIILLYTVLEIVTKGQSMPWPHLFLFQPAIWDERLTTQFVFLSMTTLILMFVTFFFIKRGDRKPQ